MDHAIEARGVTRFYNEKRGVQNLTLNIPAGRIVGLLGENGSGKTTFLKLAMGMLLPDSGELTTLGVDPGFMPAEVRARVGWLSDQLAVPKSMTLAEAMELQSAYFPTWNQKLADDLIGRFALNSSNVYAGYSLGQRRRFMLVLVLSQMPELLVLDEPANGLDPAVRRELIELLIEQSAERPMTMLLSSHIMSDVERLVDHVVFLKDGRVAKQDELEELRLRVKRLCVTPEIAQFVRDRFRVVYHDEMGGAIRMVVDNFDATRLAGIEAQVEHLNLEELFLVYNQATAVAGAV